ncbi:MAG: hypothetical protein M9947_07955 [Thermomicrobiales bacterium]|nr:hypothetical protein [Thermomicrobiales bacterium]
MITRRRLLAAALALPAFGMAAPTPLHAQTPASTPPADPTLWDYLTLGPAAAYSLEQPIAVLAGNVQLQMETLGLSFPIDPTDDAQRQAWSRATYYVAIPSGISSFIALDNGPALLGFDVSQVASGAEIGESIDTLSFVRGSFDPAQVRAAQLANGYQELELDGRPVFSLSETAAVDLSNPIQQIALARLNNSTMLDDGTLVYAPTLTLLEAVLTSESTIAGMPFVAQAMATLDHPLILSTLLGPGAFLPDIAAQILANPSLDAIAATVESEMEQEQAPIVLSAIAGSTAGGPLVAPSGDATPGSDPAPPLSVSKFALVYATPEEAARAATSIESNLETGSSLRTGEPWTALFASWSVAPSDTHPSVLLTLEWRDRAARTFDLVYSRDLGFITG